MSDDIVVNVDEGPEGFHAVDTDRARMSAELKAIQLDEMESIEKVKDMSIEVSCKLLQEIGLPEYIPLFEEKRIGIRELRGIDTDGLLSLGIEDVLHRSLILEAAPKDIRADCPKAKDTPLEVRVKMGFARLADINTVNGSCNIKLFVDLYWNDPRLIGVHQDHLPHDFMWFPDGYFYNSIDRTGEGGGHVNEHELFLTDPATGLILRPFELEVTMSFRMNLQQFPFDENPIKFQFLQGEEHSASEFLLSPAKDMASCIKFFYNTAETPEFDLVGYSMDFVTSMGGNGVQYSSAFLSIHVRRRPMYYIWKSVLPLFVTTTFAFATFFFEVDELEARATTAQTILLTTVALLYVLATELPKTSYLTRIDKYLLFCLFVQITVLVLSCAHTLRDLDNEDEKEKAEVVDFYAAIIIPSMFLLGTILAFAYPLLSWLFSSFDRRPKYPINSMMKEKGKLEYYPLAEGRNIFF